MVVASLPRRVLAGLIDAILFIGATAAAVTGAVLLAKVVPLERLSRRRRIRRIGSLGPALSTPRGRLGVNAISLMLGVKYRNSRGPGSRLLGLRLVELASGESVGVRASLVRNCVWICHRELANWIFRPVPRANKARMSEFGAAQRALQAELEALRARHANDPEACQRAMLEAYRKRDVKPLYACVWILPRVLAPYVTDLPTLRRPLRQSLADCLAGTTVPVER